MLKLIKTLMFVAIFSNVSMAQDSTKKQVLLKGKINKIGLVGTLSGQYASINGGFQPAGGASLSLLFNEKFSVGLASYRFHRPNSATTGDLQTRGGVHGLQLQYITNANKLVHFSFPLLIGMGHASNDSLGTGTGVRFGGKGGPGGRFGNRDFDGFKAGNGTNFMVIQPGINMEVNVLKCLSVFAGVNYRIALNSSSSTLTNDKLSGLGIEVGIKGGMYNLPSIRRSKKH